MKTIFEKEYSSEELCDIERDTWECFDNEYNAIMDEIPRDEHGFHSGSFKVTIVWTPDE